VTLLRVLSRSTRLRNVAVALALVLVALAVGAFALDTGGTSPEPVAFEQTTAVGLSFEDRRILESQNRSLPRAQVFYSQYRFVVGYNGIEYAVDSLQQDGHTRQFGYPLAVYVTDFAGRNVTVTEQGYLRAEGERTWTDAERAHFVVGSAARTPAGETVVPFSTESAATAFTATYGGEVMGWERLQRQSFNITDATLVREQVDDRHALADARVRAARPTGERAPRLVVGEDAASIQAAIDAAPPNATVVVPPGTYEERLRIDKPLTLRGAGATLDATNGTGIRVRSDDVAVTGLRIVGVGTETDADEGEVDESQWDADIAAGYGFGDAALTADSVARTYIRNVSIETPTNGLIFRGVEGGVLDSVTVEGSETWEDGFMGVTALRSPVVVQNSTFVDGRDGIYLHRASGSVVRNSTFRSNRFGIHFMFTSDTLAADSTFRNQSSTGIILMTDPAGNAIVGNDVRNTEVGILPVGSRSYIAENVVANNTFGIRAGASMSLYERNVVYGNEVGMDTGSLHPSSRVIRNDFVANDRHAEAGLGPLRIWTHDGTGNYWAGVTQGGSYSPTDPTEGVQHQTPGAASLAASPAASMLDAVRTTSPGMRDGHIVDTAPLAEPVRPGVIAALDDESPRANDSRGER
jgi:parallel beta-helix repeat protein